MSLAISTLKANTHYPNRLLAPFIPNRGIREIFCGVAPALGYSDGNMLVHLIWGTQAGGLLLKHLRVTRQQQQQAQAATGQSLSPAIF